jgi:hypothetical protein
VAELFLIVDGVERITAVICNGSRQRETQSDQFSRPLPQEQVVGLARARRPDAPA